jgi:reverse gyrase
MKLYAIQRQKLGKREWVVSTLHSLTQEAVTSYMNENGLGDPITKDIIYQSHVVKGYSVDFAVAEYLVTNKMYLGFEYEIYSRISRNSPWHKWKEEKKTIKEKVKKLLHTKRIRPAI